MQSASVLTYECHEVESRTHRLGEDDVRVLRFGASGFGAVCACRSADDLDGAGERPHDLSAPVVPLPAANLDPEGWLQVEELADGWFDNPEAEPVGGGETTRPQRMKVRREKEAQTA